LPTTLEVLNQLQSFQVDEKQENEGFEEHSQFIIFSF
jgi:hypothetical protein